MRTTKLVLALVLFSAALLLFLRLVESSALGSSLIVLGILAATGVGLSFVGLPKRPPRERRTR
jgi:hypothetical protein